MNKYFVKYLCIKDFTPTLTPNIIIFSKDTTYYVKRNSIRGVYTVYDNTHNKIGSIDIVLLKEYFINFRQFREDRINSILED